MDPVLFVAGIDPLRAVAGKKVPVVHQSRAPLDNRHADVFCAAGEYRGLKNYQCILTNHPPQQLGGALQRRQVRLLAVIDGGGYGDDIDIACAYVIFDRSEEQTSELQSRGKIV